ncbi:MAG: HAD-superfamily hydrolase subfamily variant 3 [Acidobacteriaceae bacterium]|nr:HAD-superfamily hydrolase subfamily variant 3 [Acidobacteriaceae bacterium]
MNFSCQAILFDLDGVLVDSTAAVERVWRKWAMEHALHADYVVKNAHGRRSIETIRLLAPTLDSERENEIVEGMEIADKDGVVAIAGARELLLSLPAERFTIVTSATRALAQARLEFAGLPVPKRFIAAEDVVNGKPSPEPYLKGAALLAVPPGECIVFEDTPAGIQAGHAAGMRTIAVRSTYPAEALTAADAAVGSLAEVAVDHTIEKLRIQINCSRFASDSG